MNERVKEAIERFIYSRSGIVFFICLGVFILALKLAWFVAQARIVFGD